MVIDWNHLNEFLWCVCSACRGVNWSQLSKGNDHLHFQIDKQIVSYVFFFKKKHILELLSNISKWNCQKNFICALIKTMLTPNWGGRNQCDKNNKSRNKKNQSNSATLISHTKQFQENSVSLIIIMNKLQYELHFLKQTSYFLNQSKTQEST
jgi:hypothetical protein